MLLYGFDDIRVVFHVGDFSLTVSQPQLKMLDQRQLKVGDGLPFIRKSYIIRFVTDFALLLRVSKTGS